MGSITKRKNSDGTISFRVDVRRKNIDISRTFFTEEDASLFILYKERLIDNMKNFDVPLKERVTLKQLFELKLSSISETNKRMIDDLNHTLDKLEMNFPKDKFVSQLTYEDWLIAAKAIYETPVYVGFKNAKNMKQMSIVTFKKLMANASSVFSHAISKGLDLENHALAIIRKYITPLMQ